MVEINNQRKAFLDMLAWSEGTDNGRQKTRNHEQDVIAGGELFTDYLITSQTCHAKPKNSTNRRRTLPASFPLVGCLPQEAIRKTSLRKSQDAVALQQIKERGALPMIDRGDIRVRQSTVAAISGLHCRALVMVSSSKADSLIAKFKEAGGTVERLMYEQSHRDYSCSGYLHHRLPVMGC